MKPNNSFLIAGYQSPEFFCDRKQETATMLDALRNGRNLILIAPRRMGKTGLICHAFYQLKEQGSWGNGCVDRRSDAQYGERNCLHQNVRPI